MLTKEQAYLLYKIWEDEYDKFKAEGLLPDRGDPEAIKKMEELLARELKEDDFDTYTENELRFLYSMDIMRLNEKSSGLVDYCMAVFE